MSTLSKAQQVRMERSMAFKRTLFLKLDEIFDWILDIINQKTDERDYHKLILYVDEYRYLRVLDNEKKREDNYGCYDLRKILSEYDEEFFVEKLKKKIEDEEGYKVKLKEECLNGAKKPSTVIIVEVSVDFSLG